MKIIISLPIAIFVHFCLIATLRVLQFLTAGVYGGSYKGGYEEWKKFYFDLSGVTFFDWWILFIPSFIAAYLLSYAPIKVQVAIYILLGLVTTYFIFLPF